MVYHLTTMSKSLYNFYLFPVFAGTVKDTLSKGILSCHVPWPSFACALINVFAACPDISVSLVLTVEGVPVGF